MYFSAMRLTIRDFTEKATEAAMCLKRNGQYDRKPKTSEMVGGARVKDPDPSSQQIGEALPKGTDDLLGS